MKNNKRILIIGPHPPLRGGISEFNYISYKNLKDLCNVFVISLKKNYPNFLFPGKSQFTKSRTANKNFQNFNIYKKIKFFFFEQLYKLAEKNKNLYILDFQITLFKSYLT